MALKDLNSDYFYDNLIVLFWPRHPQSPSTPIVWKRAAWTFFEISSFMFHRRKKVVQVWNDTRV